MPGFGGSGGGDENARTCLKTVQSGVSERRRAIKEALGFA